jgi:hypothetical protein
MHSFIRYLALMVLGSIVVSNTYRTYLSRRPLNDSSILVRSPSYVFLVTGAPFAANKKKKKRKRNDETCVVAEERRKRKKKSVMGVE